MLGKALTTAAAGNAGAAGALGIEDIFSTWLYTGNGSTQTITNGIDLAGEGGMVWIKHRNYANSHQLYDTIRGAGAPLYSNITNGEGSNPSFTAFTSSGFSLSSAASLDAINGDSSQTYASWTFRKAPGFFDVVTYTGDGTSGRTLSHNLQGKIGAVIIKRTDSTGDWYVAARVSDTDYTVGASNSILTLNSTNGGGSTFSHAAYWTDTTFKLSAFWQETTTVNITGATYVAYLFAHDEQIFGENEDQSVIKCGSYTGNGSTSGPVIDLGWEPQWVLIKRTDSNASWYLYDNMRGMVVGSGDYALFPNLSNAETIADFIDPKSTGFNITATSVNINASGSTYIYIAIRRGPMKTPTSGTEVFNVNAYSGTGATRDITGIGFPLDANLTMRRETHTVNIFVSRLQGLSCNGSTIDTPQLATNATDLESTGVVNGINATSGSAMDGYTIFNAYSQLNSSGGTYASYSFRRAPGFFDVVAYTGNGTTQALSHNLAAVPELIIIKNRTSSTQNWQVGSSGIGWTKRLRLNLADAEQTNTSYWNDTAPTSSVFTVGSAASANANSSGHIAYLFATCPGVSKVGSYTGTGTTLDIDCGFTSGARFVLIKRTDSTGDWYVWDTARGIVAANDPFLLLNSTAAENTSTDYIDPLSSGFQISSTAPAAINANGGSYIFLAIA